MEREDIIEQATILSKCTTTSSIALAAATARAKSEGAQARAAFSEREILIRTEKARLEATLDALEREREAVAARAEAAVMEAAAEEFEAREEYKPLLQPLQGAQQRTEEYVSKHSHLSGSKILLKEHSSTHEKTSHHVSSCASVCEEREDKPSAFIHNQPTSHSAVSGMHGNKGVAEQTSSQLLNSHQQYARDLPVHTPAYSPHRPYTTTAYHPSKDTATSDLAKYLSKSQLVSSGLTRFDDKPENYLCWKMSFNNTIEGLDLKAGEEIDLLIKWLGTESAEHARRVKSVNVRNPSAGLCLIWERLEEMYGSPEAIEGALFTKLEKFPKVAFKEHHKLRELSDLLLEIESVKHEGYLPGLSYLDTARGISSGGSTLNHSPGEIRSGYPPIYSHPSERKKAMFYHNYISVRRTLYFSIPQILQQNILKTQFCTNQYKLSELKYTLCT
ncbi:uncharacterized protein LOC130440302 [Triplophysa dalaica]|uniref:uncharacterized protein LOC130440302 n=1 Tax=Triplophysa dalaica TaxID=1582913 RepID=UPI0024E03BFD|nr:uncharacterized protein LOC130440302 [Triplophysa dalaica]